MKSLTRLLLLATQFEQKLHKSAQAVMPAAPEDIEQALDRAQLFKPADVQGVISPLLDQLHIPATTEVSIDVEFNAQYKPRFIVNLTPPEPRQTVGLAALLRTKFTTPMTNALMGGKLTTTKDGQTIPVSIINPVQIKWQLFK